MKRLHLFEFEDQLWLPETLRSGTTAYLRAAYQSMGVPALWAREIETVLQATGQEQIVDLGSGSSGPVVPVVEELLKMGRPVTAILTDLFPRALVFENQGVRYWPNPVDARAIPPDLRGVRTMFASFHHFRPVDAEKILAEAASAQVPICVFEATSRSLAAILSSLLIPILVLLLTPRIRPLRLAQLLLTYVIPVLPAIIFWDGLVSHLRTYLASEMMEMAERHPVAGYRWRTGTVPIQGLPQGLPFLIGQPAGGGEIGSEGGKRNEAEGL